MRKILLYIFYAALLICASLVLSFVWGGGPQAELYAQLAATAFIVGLASFLVWFTLTLIVITERIAKE